MRVGYSGDQDEARALLGAAQQEMWRLELRMRTQMRTQGSFWHRLSDTAYCYGNVTPNGIKSLYIVVDEAGPVSVEDLIYFEFATSAFPIVRADTTVDGITFSGYSGCVVGVNVRAKDGVMSTRPVILGNKRSTSGADVSLIGRAFQAQLLNEPASYPFPSGGHYPEALYESYAPVNPHTGVLLRSTELVRGRSDRPNTGPLTQHVTRDIVYDVPYQHGNGTDKVTQAYLQEPADWPRASGYQHVVQPGIGKRSFAISVDAFNQFSVFPVDAITAVDPTDPHAQNVISDFVQMVKPTLPGWCYAPSAKARDYYAGDPDPQHALVDQPELDWKFNPTGTKAASIVYARSPFTYDATFWSTDLGDDVFPFESGLFDRVAGAMGVLSRRDEPDDGHAPDRFFTAPGIVEVSLAISIDGPGLSEFTPTITVRVVRDPATATLCPLFCGYVWYDIAGVRVDPLIPVPNLASAGDLVAFDIERWAPKTGSLAAWTVAPAGNLAHIVSIKNLNTGAEIASYDANEIIAVDVPTLSFVMLTYPHATSVSSGLNTFGAAVYVNTTLREVLYPLAQPTVLQKQQMTAQAKIVGRDEISALIAADPRWQLVPLNPAAGDGFTDDRMAKYRELFARGCNYFGFAAESMGSGNGFFTNSVNPFPFPVASDVSDRYKTSDLPFDEPTFESALLDALEDIGGRWAQYPGTTGVEHLFFCTAPKWGWNTYASLIASFMWASAETTFYVHPNGTWAFWCNQFVNNSAPYDDQFTARLATFFTTAKLEHVLFDRVHLEMANGTQTLSTDTTFFDLYNRATQAGLDSGKLEDGIGLMTPTNVRASVVYDEFFYNAGDRLVETLQLKATIGAQSWYLPDPNVWGVVIPSSADRGDLPFGGMSVAPTLAQPWFNATSYGGGRSIPVQSPHARFANPALLGA